jgi:hypothetical protein
MSTRSKKYLKTYAEVIPGTSPHYRPLHHRSSLEPGEITTASPTRKVDAPLREPSNMSLSYSLPQSSPSSNLQPSRHHARPSASIAHLCSRPNTAGVPTATRSWLLLVALYLYAEGTSLHHLKSSSLSLSSLRPVKLASALWCSSRRKTAPSKFNAEHGLLPLLSGSSLTWTHGHPFLMLRLAVEEGMADGAERRYRHTELAPR